MPESANLELFSFHKEEDQDYEDFNLITFKKPLPSYLANNFNAEPSVSRDGRILLNDSLVALTHSEGHGDNSNNFYISNQYKEFADLFRLINTPDLTFWPDGKVFDEYHKKTYYFDIENIKMSISAFQGHAALAQLTYPSKVNDVEFLSKVIIGPLRKSMDLIQNLVRSFRSRALPRYINEDVRRAIIKADLRQIWNLTEDQRAAIKSCFRKSPLPRGGGHSFRARFNFNKFQRGRFNFFRGNYNRYRTLQAKRGSRRGGFRGGRYQNGQTNSGQKEKKDK